MSEVSDCRFRGTLRRPIHFAVDRTEAGELRTSRRRIGSVDELVCKPGSVPGGLSAIPFGDHPSRRAVAGSLQRFTRRLGRAALERLRTSDRHRRRRSNALNLAPGGVYRAAPVTRHAGGLLHHRFTLTCGTGPKSPVPPGGLFSVALSRGSRRVAVDNHPALWSPDFPRRWDRLAPIASDAVARPTRPGRTVPARAARRVSTGAPVWSGSVTDPAADR